MTVTDSSRSRFFIPHWGWFLLATVVLVVGFVVVSTWLPYHREQQVIQKIHGWGGKVDTQATSPVWVRKILGDNRMKEDKFVLFRRVSSVDLRSTVIIDADVVHLSRLTYLEDLDLRGTAVSDAGIAHLNGLRNLRFLNLGGTSVTGIGLGELRDSTNLRFLHLDGTPMTESGVAQLRSFTNIQILTINETALTDAIVADLSHLRSLRSLQLTHTKVTQEGVDLLKRALPQCTIIRSQLP